MDFLRIRFPVNGILIQRNSIERNSLEFDFRSIEFLSNEIPSNGIHFALRLRQPIFVWFQQQRTGPNSCQQPERCKPLHHLGCAILVLFGSILVPFGSILVPFWCHFAPLLALFGPLGCPVGSIWLPLGSLWLSLAPGRLPLGPLWLPLGSLRLPFGSLCRPFGSLLAPFWSISGSIRHLFSILFLRWFSHAFFEDFWAHFEAMLAPFLMIFGAAAFPKRRSNTKRRFSELVINSLCFSCVF